jgi:hypothetical protein
VKAYAVSWVERDWSLAGDFRHIRANGCGLLLALCLTVVMAFRSSVSFRVGDTLVRVVRRHPQVWYMSRVGDPNDWDCEESDDGS